MVMTIEITEAKIGRSMKNRENTELILESAGTRWSLAEADDGMPVRGL